MHISSESLVEALRSADLRITAPRRAICEVIADGHGRHLTAAEILEAAHLRSKAKIDQSTVYRTLEVLEDKGVLAHSHLGHGASVYHLAEEAGHQHLVCANCGATAAIPQDDLAEFFDEIERRTGFVADPTHFALSGLCANCAAAVTP